VSEPASKVSATTLLPGSPRRMTCALGPAGRGGTVGVAVGGGGRGVGVCVEVGVAVAVAVGVYVAVGVGVGVGDAFPKPQPARLSAKATNAAASRRLA